MDAAAPRAALLRTSTAQSGAEAERDAALDAVVHDALARLQVVEVTARPALDLETIQLSLDCVGETATCLSAVAQKLQTDVLIAPAIQRTDDSLVLGILSYDARASQLRRVTRHQAGRELQAATLDEVPAMLRELLQVEAPPAAAEQTPVPPLTAPQEPDPESESGWTEEPSEPEDDGVPLGPVLLAGGGALTIGAGVAAALMMLDTQDEYEALEVTSASDADAAEDKLAQGRTEAMVASVLLGTGGAALAASAVWLAIDLTDEDAATEAALRPMLTPNRAGLMLRGNWEGGP